MILDGRYIEDGSIPLSKLATDVETLTDALGEHAAINDEISNIKNCNNGGTVPLQIFYNRTVNHLSTLINDESSENSPTHTIKDDSITNNMLSSALKNRLVFTDVVNKDSGEGANPITAYKAFTGGAKVSTSAASAALEVAASSANNPAISVTAGVSNLKATNITGDLAVTGNLNVSGNLTLTGSVTTVNQSTVNVTDYDIVLAKGATTSTMSLTAASLASACPGVVIDLKGDSTTKKVPKLFYNYADRTTSTGWHVHEYGEADSAGKALATVDYVTSQVTAAGGTAATGISALKKDVYIGTATIAANTKSITVNLPQASGITGTNFKVFLTPTCTSTGLAVTTNALNSAGTIAVNKQSGAFTIFCSGTPASSISFDYMAVKYNTSSGGLA